MHPDDLSDLRRSELSDDTITAMGCRSVDPREVKQLTGVNVDQSGYLIPYPNVMDQTGAPYVRVRLRDASPNKRYVSGAGDDPQVYIPPNFNTLANSGMLVITEGEKKAAKAVQDGIRCIAIQGVFNGFDPGERARERSLGLKVTGETAPNQMLLEIARGYDLVLVLGDSDLLGNPQAKSGIDSLAKSLRQNGVEAIAAYCPPVIKLDDGKLNTTKQGLDDWLIADGLAVKRGLAALAFGAEVAREGITDTFNARSIARMFKNELVFSRSAWHTWDGAVWSQDSAGQHRRLASRIGDLYRSFAETLTCLNRRVTSPFGDKSAWPDEVKAWSAPIAVATSEALKAAEKIGSLRGMDAAFTVAEALLHQPGDIWDRQPELLGVRNGVVDLRTGELLKAKPEYHITRSAAVNYDPSATCPGFERFLARVQPQKEMRDFLQELIGYSATGHAREQKFFIFQGPGGGGKSLYESLMTEALGTYAAKAATGLLAQQAADRPRNDLAALAGVRFVSLSETSAHFVIDEALVKTVTGDDLICARFLNKEFFQFRPQFTPILDTNHVPRFREVGTAMVRRVRVVPWDVTIPERERDTALRERLVAELPGVLAWVVRGATRYLQTGLREPEAVMRASRGHMAQCDPIGRWVEERTVLAPAARIKSKIAYADYTLWASDESELVVASMNEFGRRLKDRGWISMKTGGVMCWTGHRLRDQRDGVSQPSAEDSAASKPALRSGPGDRDGMPLVQPGAVCQPTPGGNYLA